MSHMVIKGSVQVSAVTYLGIFVLLAVLLVSIGLAVGARR